MFVVTSMSHNSETTNTPSWSRKPRHQDLLQSNPPYALPPVLILLEITAYSAVSHRTITWQIVVTMYNFVCLMSRSVTVVYHVQLQFTFINCDWGNDVYWYNVFCACLKLYLITKKISMHKRNWYVRM